MEVEDAVYSEPLPLQAQRLITGPSLLPGLPGSFPVTSSLPPGSAASIRPGGHVRETDCHHMQRGKKRKRKEKKNFNSWISRLSNDWLARSLPYIIYALSLKFRLLNINQFIKKMLNAEMFSSQVASLNIYLLQQHNSTFCFVLIDSQELEVFPLWIHS